jgi:branched-subunit amino acid aminotransferase/4-amino-4-deoxychorismate lyase
MNECIATYLIANVLRGGSFLNGITRQEIMNKITSLGLRRPRGAIGQLLAEQEDSASAYVLVNVPPQRD